MEVVVTSECSGQLWNVCVWDPLTGTTLRTFKGGISCSKTLSIVGGDYILSAQKDKPLLQTWALNRQDQLTSKTVVPGVIQVLRVSPCSTYCVGAAAEQIHLWLLSTGKMLASLSRHYQNVADVKWTADSSHVVSAGTEGLVLSWSLESILEGNYEPEKTWSDHSLPVTCLHVTSSLAQPLIFSTSLDQTLKIRQLDTGNTLLSLQFHEPLYSVVVDHAEEKCYVGSSSGRIHSVSLLDPPRRTEDSAENGLMTAFCGHEKAVNSLSISLDGSQLLSGSEDGAARLWDIGSGQCVRILAHRGPLTNAFFAPRFRHFEADKLAPKSALVQFEKSVERNSNVNAVVCIRENPNLFSGSGRDGEDDDYSAEQQLVRAQLTDCQRVNRQLYNFAVEKILKNVEIPPAVAVASSKKTGWKKTKTGRT